jgi:hypothetical protein
MLIPYRTLSDPEVQGEGSIDPLGLATLADRLADWVLPGMTARMWRPRFLTAMALTSLVVEPFAEELAVDRSTPPWLVLEWYYVEAAAAIKDGREGLRRVPGIDKARQALRDGVPMNADRYLKTPKVFGFHGIYKRLARHVDIVDDDLALGEQGYRLLKIWEQEQGYSGFSDRELIEGLGPKIRRTLREAIRGALEAAQTVRHGEWPGASFFVEHLVPARAGHREAEFLWQLFLGPGAETRSEIFRFLREPHLRQELREEKDERRIADKLRGRASSELRRRLDAIEAYEGVCRPLQESWDRLRHLSTLRQPSVIGPGDTDRDPRTTEIAALLRPAVERAREALRDSPIASDFETMGRKFGDVRTGAELFAVLWEHHRDVQARKPPEGKRPWLEETAEGFLVLRPPYRLDEAPVREEYVHPYRLTSVGSFIDDLAGGT